MNTPDRRFRYRCLTFAASLAATTAALTPPVVAADMAVKAPPAPFQYNWTGFYFGVHGGWGWASTYVDDPLFNPPRSPIQITYNGPLAGGALGANWQFGNVVYGLEVDGSWSFVRGLTFSNSQDILSSTQRNVFDFRAFVTGTGRVGYAMGAWLAYAKAGGAWAEQRISAPIFANNTDYNRSLFGAVAGVGIEVAFLRNVSAKVEYNFLYFPTDRVVYADHNTVSSIDHFVQMVKGGINVHFGG
jgi:outer membrane immunogenic protein